MRTSPLKVAVIGSGFSGLSAACYAAKAGHEVHIFEKNESIGGRARNFTSHGYTFDMGPSWYWMPDVFQDFFQDFNYNSTDFYELIRLDPQFEILFQDHTIAFPDSIDKMIDLFESFEKGAGLQLKRFLSDAKIKYDIGMKDFISKPCHSWTEFISLKIAKNALKLDLLTNFRNYVNNHFTHPYLRTIMEFPVIFLGASPKNIPALYSLMNYGGYQLGTWYPMGGFSSVINAMETIAKNLGVAIHTGSTVQKINVFNNQLKSLVVNGENILFDAVIASSDYQHTEELLDVNLRNYDLNYWHKKTFAPSCLIYFLGVREKIPNLTHHTLFFENELDQHIDQIYVNKKWPDQPLFYVCCPSKTDKKVAPEGHENLFLLMPIATDLEDSESIREKYLVQMLNRIEKKTGIVDLKSKLDYIKSYSIKDFKLDYNAYGGNAYGLANTLNQTAILKPSIKNKKVKNLFYTGQLTVPGPGVPPSIISGKIVANELNYKTKL